MKLFVIDANLVYSAIRNPDSKIGQFLIQANNYECELFAPTYLRAEIERHLPKMSLKTSQPTTVLEQRAEVYFSLISFIDDTLLPFDTIIRAMRIVRDVDPDDVLYVALNDDLNGTLFTGDKRLYQGLLAKGYNRVINFKSLQKELGL